MYLTENITQKWQAVLDHPDLAPIKDPYRRAVTTRILENQYEDFVKNGSQIINEISSVGTGGFTGGAAATGPTAGFDPILISLVRRSLPNLIAYDVCGVQPMTGPSGLIFAMRTMYNGQQVGAGNNAEAFYNEANTAFSGQGSHTAISLAANTEIGSGNVFTQSTGHPFFTGDAEALGNGVGPDFNEMAFSIEKVPVTAKTRTLKSEYTVELAQDLKAVHGLDAETELANILTSEILAEINREIIRTIYYTSKVGAQVGTTTRGTFNLDTDSNGRWMVEKIKGLAFQIEREANAIAKTTRRGKGNFIICSSDVASALAMAGILDYNSALQSQMNLQVDDTGNTFAGTIFGRIKVYIDPYFPVSSSNEFAVVGYKGSSAYDAGMFYCPYVPLQMARAVDTGTFQPKIAFKTRYGLVANPFAEGTVQGGGALNPMSNSYYRAFKIANLI